MRGTLVALAAAGFILGLAALALVLTGDHDDVTGPFVVLALTLGWSFIATGLYAVWRRPEQSVGRLMTLVGFLWFLGALPESDSPLVHSLGLALGGLWAGPLVHLLIAFPSGRVAPGLERTLVRTGYAIPLLEPIALLFSAQPTPDCKRCPDNVLLVADDDTAFGILTTLLGIAGVAMLVGVCVVLVRRWRRSGPVQRRALAPVLWAGGAVVVVALAGVIPSLLGAEKATEVAQVALIAAITAVP